MLISLKKLKKLSVQTESGIVLGKIFGIIFQTEGQSVVQYEVRPNYLIGKKYLISSSQVVRFEENKMIVGDNVKPVEISKQVEMGTAV